MAHGKHQILLTGFEPFGEDSVNPSWEIARALDGAIIEGAIVRSVRLPCVFGDSIAALDRAIAETGPMLIVCLGYAANRSDITPERVGINIDDARIPDNAGNRPIDAPVLADGPPAYFCTLPIKAMTQAMRDAGVAASVSNTAGTFVCNHICYAVMDRLAKGAARKDARGGFIHVPPLPGQASRARDASAMELGEQVKGIRAAIAAAMTTRDDLRLSAGQIS
ncbi:pyroglutamyl-peptidase I [Diaphorobacter ruginosibacter]|uniref:pyroglutamyl-peptidase I n=1 Tax=Diaphorobacter ruginosibacter TaxID=1715720 RepID=UPI003340832B